MNLSNTAQYAIRVISFMALGTDKMYSSARLVDELKLSDKYLKRILTTLSNHGIITSIQGRYGGYVLNKEVTEIKLYDIIKAVENIEKYFGCVLGFEQCSDVNPCSLHLKWIPVRNELYSFLNKTTMDDVMKNPEIMKF